jgi:hypothetical protein
MERLTGRDSAGGGRLEHLVGSPDGYVPDRRRSGHFGRRLAGNGHDTRGVWIGDGSALPIASGVDPMITIMALARRTAAHLRESMA